MPSEAASHGVTPVRARRVLWACGCDSLRLARIADATHGEVAVHAIAGPRELVALLHGAGETPEVIVLAVSAHEVRDAVALVRYVRTGRPRAALVAYCDDVRDAPPAIGALAAAGVHQFLFLGVNDRGVVLRATLDGARQQCTAEIVMAALRPHLPVETHPMVEAALARPSVVTDVAALAGALGVHRKTLFNRCVQTGLVKPAALLAWTRIALAGYLLETTGCTVESLSLELGFPSPTALRNAVKRYTGRRATDVRDAGGLAVVIACMRARLRGGAPAERLHLV